MEVSSAAVWNEVISEIVMLIDPEIGLSELTLVFIGKPGDELDSNVFNNLTKTFSK